MSQNLETVSKNLQLTNGRFMTIYSHFGQLHKYLSQDRRIYMQLLWVCLRIEKLLVFRHALRRISTGCFTIDYHFSNLNRPKSQFCKKKLQGQALCFLPPRDKKKSTLDPHFWS